MYTTHITSKFLTSFLINILLVHAVNFFTKYILQDDGVWFPAWWTAPSVKVLFNLRLIATQFWNCVAVLLRKLNSFHHCNYTLLSIGPHCIVIEIMKRLGPGYKPGFLWGKLDEMKTIKNNALFFKTRWICNLRPLAIIHIMDSLRDMYDECSHTPPCIYGPMFRHPLYIYGWVVGTLGCRNIGL